jgi:SUN domain-containing protein 1/2
VQTFMLDAATTQPVDQVMVRVTENWGADHTCIYRVRFHGRDSLPRHDYTGL